MLGGRRTRSRSPQKESPSKRFRKDEISEEPPLDHRGLRQYPPDPNGMFRGKYYRPRDSKSPSLDPTSPKYLSPTTVRNSRLMRGASSSPKGNDGMFQPEIPPFGGRTTRSRSHSLGKGKGKEPDWENVIPRSGGSSKATNTTNESNSKETQESSHVGSNRRSKCPLLDSSASNIFDYKNLLGHANDILETIDNHYAQYGGILSLLAPPGHPQRLLIQDTYIGQWMIYTTNLSMRVAQLEIEVENSRNVLAGEATAPWVLGRASFFGGGEGGEFGRELLFPQDRYVLSGLSQGLWERLDEKLLSEAKRKNKVEGKMAAEVRGGRVKPGSKEPGYEAVPTLPGRPLEPIVWVDTKSRIYRVQGQDTMFVVLGHGGDLNPDTEFAARLEKMPLVSVLPHPISGPSALGQDDDKVWQDMEKETRITQLLEQQQVLRRELHLRTSAFEILKRAKENKEELSTTGGLDEYKLLKKQLEIKTAECVKKDALVKQYAEEKEILKNAVREKNTGKDKRAIEALNEGLILQRKLAAQEQVNEKLRKRLNMLEKESVLTEKTEVQEEKHEEKKEEAEDEDEEDKGKKVHRRKPTRVMKLRTR